MTGSKTRKLLFQAFLENGSLPIRDWVRMGNPGGDP